MKYYELMAYAPRLPNGECCWMIDIPRDIHALSAGDGKRLTKWNPKLIAVYADAPAVFDFGVVGCRMYPIFSSRLRAFFEGAYPRLIQFFPIRLQRDDGALPMHGYALAKFLQVVECIDRKRTRVEDNDWTPNRGGEYRTWGPLYLCRSALRDAVCFLVKGDCHTIVCRDDLRLALEREGFKGFKFYDVKVSEKA